MKESILNLFKKIKAVNPDIILTGSNALSLQGIKLRTEPNDLDLLLPKSVKEFNTIEGFEFIEQQEYPNDEPGFMWSYHYKLKDSIIKIDIFQGLNSYIEPRKIKLESVGWCTYYLDILQFKLKHSFANNRLSSKKQASDLIYILINNSHLKYFSFGDITNSIFGQPVLSNQKEFHETIILKKPIVFFDTETTGINKTTDRIVELSAIKLMPDNTKIQLNERFNPTIPIPAEATAVHKITNDDVKNKPKFKERAKDISKFFQNCDIGGYNIIDFDVPLIVEEFLRSGIDIPFNNETKFIDSLKIYFQNEKRDLTSAYEFYCEKKLSNAHSAEADNNATIEVLQKQIERYRLPKSITHLNDICSGGEEVLDYDRKFTKNNEGYIVFTFGKNKNLRVYDQHDYLNWMLKQDFANHTKLIIKQILSGELNDGENDLDDLDLLF